MKKALCTVLLGLLAGLCLGNVAHAAGGFDAAYYARKYPDVVAALGTDPAVLYNHYVTYGINEHRFQNLTEEVEAWQAQLEQPQQAVKQAPEASQPAAQPAQPAPGQPIENPAPTNTYVDVDIENQVMTYYENGSIRLQSPCVTGNTSRGCSTPVGTYSIYMKTPGKYLVGPTWNVWVDRWMRFTAGGVGLHDASWRSAFGGSIYKTNGSHGCVNLPHDVALQLYDMVSNGTIVKVH